MLVARENFFTAGHKATSCLKVELSNHCYQGASHATNFYFEGHTNQGT